MLQVVVVASNGTHSGVQDVWEYVSRETCMGSPVLPHLTNTLGLQYPHYALHIHVHALYLSRHGGYTCACMCTVKSMYIHVHVHVNVLYMYIHISRVYNK